MWRPLREFFSAVLRAVPPSQRRRPRIAFEGLEPRLLLSADPLPATGLLEIVGTETHDAVIIRELEARDGGAARLEVVFNGQAVQYGLDGLSAIKVDLLGGNDQLDIDVATAIDWDIALGEGDDRARISTAIGDAFAAASYRVDAGEGNNETAIRFGDGQHGARPPAGETEVRVEYRSGGGDDRLSFEWLAQSDRPLRVAFEAFTGAGEDTVEVNAAQAAAIVTGAGREPHVKVFKGETPAVDSSFFAYPAGFTGGVRVATGDVNGDGIADLITGTGPGAAAHVKVFDGASGDEMHSFFAYDPAFSGGVFVAAGDVNGDGRADIITGSDAGAGGGQVKVFDGATLDVLHSFFAYAPDFSGGVRVASGDVNGDGLDDIVTGSGAGAAAHVKVFDGGSGETLRSFFAYDPAFTGGVFVAAGDVNGDGRADLITGSDAGAGGGHVKAFDGASLEVLQSFFAHAPSFSGGVRVAAGDVNGDGFDDIITGAGAGGAPLVKAFDARTGAEIRSFLAYGADFTGGVFVASGDLNDSAGPMAFDLKIDAGDGDDAVAVRFNPKEYTISKPVPWQAGILAGGGDDTVAVALLLPAIQAAREAARVHVDGGEGVDTLSVHTGNSPAVAYFRSVDGLSSEQEIIEHKLSLDDRGTLLDMAALETLALHTGAGADRIAIEVDRPSAPLPALEFATGGGDDVVSAELAGVSGIVAFDLGSGADSLALRWRQGAGDSSAAVRVQLGGADADRPQIGDEVLVVFEHGDARQPLIIGTLWSSQDRTPEDEAKSLSIDMTSARGVLDWSGELRGGAGSDSVQVFLEGRLKAAGNALNLPRLQGFFDLGGGDDAFVLDLSKLVIIGAADDVPIRFTVLAGAGEDALGVRGTSRADAFLVTGSEVVLAGAALVEHSGFESLLVEGLGGNDTLEMAAREAPPATTLDGGAGDDLLLGGPGDDILLGGPGDDLLAGGGGEDILDGGPGDNVIIDGAANVALVRAVDANLRVASELPSGRAQGSSGARGRGSPLA